MLAAWLFALAHGSLGGCDNGISCSQVKANGLTFDCRWAGPEDGTKVMMLHGFPEWSSMYMPLMRGLAAKGYRSIACNQRGYSPGARPNSVNDYLYDTLMSDVWAVADAIGYKKFHLIGHDHGAVLGWCVAASARGATELLSYTALSIPHVDAFSAGLFGAAADQDQQYASQYFTVFIQDGVAKMDFNALYNTLAKNGNGDSESWSSADEFQKAIWWYNGALNSGHMAVVPYYSAWTLTTHGYLAMASMRNLFGGKDTGNGKAAASPIGKVNIPALYICGSTDTAILCNHDFALKTKDYVTSAYSQLTVDCGHDLLSCGGGMFSDGKADKQVTDAIYKHLDSHSEASKQKTLSSLGDIVKAFH